MIGYDYSDIKTPADREEELEARLDKQERAAERYDNERKDLTTTNQGDYQ